MNRTAKIHFIKTFGLKTLVVLVFMLFSGFQLLAQNHIRLNVRKAPLSEVLQQLKENYGIQFAFDNDLLSNYKVSVNQSFNSQEEALAFLLKDHPLELEKSGAVFIIYPKQEISIQPQKQFTTKITGQVVESLSFEPLPFSYISINEKQVQADQQGHFSFLASADSVFDLRISHLGYYIYDTVLTESVQQKFSLVPHIEEIEEVKIEGNLVEKSTLIGDRPGKIKISHRIAPVLPGHGDNMVFNLLRLMPGILAAGEQSNDLLIWGGYESHSKIQFDGYTIFGLKNFNDNISVVNPLMVKNIEVYKGGYEARYGERVGGIVDIAGKNGTLLKPSFQFTINTTTLNSLLEVPLSKKSSLIAAYRQTYYQLYNPTTINLFGKKNDSPENITNSGIDFTVNPDYNFRDANLKYSFQGDKGSQVNLSFYGGGDLFTYNMEGSVVNNRISRLEEEKNRQLGGSASVIQAWEMGAISTFTATYSVFERTASEQNQNENIRKGTVRVSKQIESENNVDEFVLSGEHKIPFNNGHSIILGGGIISNNVSLTRASIESKIIDLQSNSPRFFSYFQDELQLYNRLNIKSGIRLIHAANLNKTFAEPRVAATLNAGEFVKINASWGLYNQFLAKTSLVDSANNYAYFWTIADKEQIPVLQAQHWVGGFSINKNGFTFSTEGYFKNTTGITRFFNGSRTLDRGFYEGNARSYGLDFFAKKEYKKHMAWISYTLSKTEEHFPFYIREYYKLAPHHQTHEIKLAAILNLNAFYISGNYVYGSGFERYSLEMENGTNIGQAYKRLDASFVYRFKPGKVKAETGISILNVLDSDNIKYSNLRRATVDDINLVGIYAEAVPFTPTLFLKIEL